MCDSGFQKIYTGINFQYNDFAAGMEHDQLGIGASSPAPFAMSKRSSSLWPFRSHVYARYGSELGFYDPNDLVSTSGPFHGPTVGLVAPNYR